MSDLRIEKRQTRTRRFDMRVTEETYDAIKARAAEHGTSAAGYIQALVASDGFSSQSPAMREAYQRALETSEWMRTAYEGLQGAYGMLVEGVIKSELGRAMEDFRSAQDSLAECAQVILRGLGDSTSGTGDRS